MPKKAPLILIHGFRGNSVGLKDIATKLKLSDYDVYTPNIPPAVDLDGDGIKDTELPDSFFTKDGYADWLADYIKRNHIERPVLIGHSLGSIIAAATAEKYPYLLADKLVLLAPIAEKPNKFFSMISPLSASLPDKLVGFVTTRYLIINQGNLDKILETTYLCTSKVTSKKDIKSAAKFSVSTSISDLNFKKDTLFLAGEKDRLSSKKVISNVADKFGAKCVFLDDCGHLLNYECPDKVVAEIEKFLKEPPYSHKNKEQKNG